MVTRPLPLHSESYTYIYRIEAEYDAESLQTPGGDLD
jgi:hypothetical protein